MPKHIIEFRLPEESEDLNLALHAEAYSSALWEIRNILRKYRNHYEFTEEESAAEFFQKLSEELYEVLAEVSD